MSILELLNPKIIGITIDAMLNKDIQSLPQWLHAIDSPEYLRKHLFIIAIIIVLISALATLFRFLFRLLNSIAAEHLVQRIRNQLFQHIIHLSFDWHNTHQTGDIIQRCTSDVDTIKSFLSDQLVTLFRIFLLITFALYFMFSIHMKLAFISAIFVPIVLIYGYCCHFKISSEFQKVEEEEGKLSAIATENLTGIRVVRSFGREIYEKNRFESHNEIYTKHLFHLYRSLLRYWISGDLFTHLKFILILSFGSYFAIHHEILACDFVTFIYYNAILTGAVRPLGRVISEMSKASISVDRIRYIMNATIETDEPNAQEIDLNQDIVFHHVNYQYKNSTQPVLQDINLTIKAGETIGILGSTGSGKSTLVYLLDKLYSLDEKNGSITIGNVDIKHIKTSYLRKNIGIVFQEPFLFSKTLKENITITQTETDEATLIQSTQIASLEDAIQHFRQGYETMVGERGVTLSGGQKQRTAIAQMLIRKPPIMIFDDSLSAVDSETDGKIRQALKKSLHQNTIILIAHRITTIMNADHIIVMDKGKIIQQGTHQTLIEKDGLYRNIFNLKLQQGEV